MVRTAEEVQRAKADIRELLLSDARDSWTIRDIQDRLSHWPGTIVALAVMDMQRKGELEMANDLSVRARELLT